MSDKSNDPRDEWTGEAFLGMVRRQVGELEAARTKLMRRGKTADDDPQLMDVVLELRAFRQILDELTRELEGGQGEEESKGGEI